MVFSDFDSIYLSMCGYFESIKLFFFSSKKKIKEHLFDIFKISGGALRISLVTSLSVPIYEPFV